VSYVTEFYGIKAVYYVAGSHPIRGQFMHYYPSLCLYLSVSSVWASDSRMKNFAFGRDILRHV